MYKDAHPFRTQCTMPIFVFFY